MAKAYHMFNVRQYALIFNDENKVLALQIPKRYSESGGKWAFPGGRMEAHDQPKGGLLREVKEETGLDIQPDGICHAGVWSSEAVSKYAVFYTATLSGDITPVLSEEHEDMTWIGEDEIAEHTFIYPTFTQAIKKAFESRK